MANSTKVGLKGSISVTYIEAERPFRPKTSMHYRPNLVETVSGKIDQNWSKLHTSVVGMFAHTHNN